MLRIIRGLSLICVVLVVVLHQVPTVITQAQTTEIDICLEYGPGCSVQWHPHWSGLLIRTVDRLTFYNVDTMEITFTYIHEGPWIEQWRPDGRAFATATIRTLRIRWAYNDFDLPYLNVIEEINFVDYENNLYEAEGIDGRSDPYMVSWHPDGTKLAFLHSYISIWDIAADAVTPIRSLGYLFEGESYLVALEWSPDGQYIALSSPYNLILIDAETYEVVLRSIYPEGYEWGDFEWNPNGQQVAIGLRRYGRPYDPAQLVVINTETGEIDTTYSTEARSIGGVAWSSDGQWLAAGTGSADRRNEEHGYVENALRIWDVETGELVEMVSNDSPIMSVDWRPDGSQIAFSDREGHIYIHEFAGE
jgi:WD40 repeat protein